MENVNKEHSICGASSSKRWFNCPGSVKLIHTKKLTDRSEYAALGTVAHKMASDFFLEGVRLDSWLDVVVEQDGFSIQITQDDIDGVETYTNYVMGKVNEWEIDNENIYIERRIPLHGKDYDGRRRFGTVDAALLDPCSRLLVVDYKNGFKQISPEDNTQALDYALGLWDTLPQDQRNWIVQITIAIVQPNALGPAIKEWNLNPAILEMHRNALDARLEAVMQPNAHFQAGEWCDDCFCPARTICPELRSKINEAFGEQLTHLARIEESRLSVANIKNMSLEEKNWLLNTEEYFKTFFKALRQEAEKDLAQGKYYQDWHLEQGLGNKRWIDKDLIDQQLAAHNIPIDVRAPRKLVNPGKVEEWLAKHGQKDFDISSLYERPKTSKRLVKGGGGSKLIEGVVVDPKEFE